MTSPPPRDPDHARVRSTAITGATGTVIEASAGISNGPDAFHIAGTPEPGIRETRDRIRSAIINSGLTWPGRAVTVTLHPAGLPRHGSGTDLAIAVAILAASGQVPASAAGGCAFTAELGLDGNLRPVPGVLPGLLAAAGAGCTRAVVAPRNAAEAMAVPGIAVVPCQNLRAVLAWLRREPFPAIPVGDEPHPDHPACGLTALAVPLSLRLALEASAAGGLHLCLTGSHGAAIPALAEGLSAMLPPLSPGEVMEASAVHSVAGLLGPGHALVTRPPFRAPHHTATRAAILGGAREGITQPGEAALAHHGVLFLADAPEFGRDVLRVLRQPLQHGELTVTRAGSTICFPAKFILVAGLAACPCGARPDCACTPLQARRYRGRLDDELGALIAIRHAVPVLVTAGTGEPAGDANAGSAARVAAARDRARHRLRGTPWRVNADIPVTELRRSFRPPAAATAPVVRAVDLGQISSRGADHVIRIAWTLADLAGTPSPGPAECGQALAFHLGTAR